LARRCNCAERSSEEDQQRGKISPVQHGFGTPKRSSCQPTTAIAYSRRDCTGSGGRRKMGT
jgi:hypothetical protein